MASRSKRFPRTPYRELLLVFAAVWLALGAYSFADDELELFDVKLAKSNIRSYLTLATTATDGGAREPVAGQATSTADPSAHPTSVTSAARPRPPIDRSPQRILIFGDSMVLNLMIRLADYCQENGHQVFPVVWYASTTLAWGTQDKLDRFIKKYRPTFIIVVLGSSEIFIKNIADRAKWVRRINEKIGPRKYIWVGPPIWRKDTGINQMLERAVGPQHYFRSSDLTLEREADGIHPTPPGAVEWMDAISRWIVQRSAVPIQLNLPTKKAPRPAAEVLPPPYKVDKDKAEKKDP